MIIAIDGPAGAGKGTLARLLGAKYGIHHIDSGQLYRILGLKSVRDPRILESNRRMIALLDAASGSAIDERAVKSHRAGEIAARISPNREVRKAVNEYLHRQAANTDDLVVDGRDIGTVVFPNAEVKFYVTATPEIRAMRRLREELAADRPVFYEIMLREILARDARDIQRPDSPLRPAADAFILDTSELTIDGALRQAGDIVEHSWRQVSREPARENQSRIEVPVRS